MCSAVENNFPDITWAEIDLKAFAHNIRELKRISSDNAAMMIAVKADGYGHGAVELSKVALEEGVEFLAVARISEAVKLREAGIDAPILLFGYSHDDCLKYMAENNIRASVNSIEDALRISQKAADLNIVITIHIKIDTGMGRLGITSDGLPAICKDKTLKQLKEINQLPGIKIEGVYTHFACADHKNKTSAIQQLNLFNNILSDLEKEGISYKYSHAANSAATIEMPEAHYDMVRPGISIYGLWPSDEINRALIDLKPVMSVKSKIIQLKDVDQGFTVSYGNTYVTSKPTKIATIPIGYADGYNRLLSSKGSMLVNGKRAPVIGRVCMDLTMIDVGHIPDVSIGDEVVVLGKQGDEEITADEIAKIVGTINYEIVSCFMPRVKRIYLR